MMRLRQSIDNFIGWLEKNGSAGYDPYDLWASGFGRFAKKVYSRNSLAGVPFVAPVFLSEILFPGIRRILARKKKYPIGHAHLIMAYLNMYEAGGDRRFLQRAEELGEELLGMSIPGYSGYCWGFPFDWQTNSDLWTSTTPLITTTPYCFEAYLRLSDLTGNEKYREIARSTAMFALRDLNETVIAEDARACSYTPRDHSTVVNANTYRAFMLLEAHARFGGEEFRETAVRNINFVLRSQNGDGSWLYEPGNPKNAFIDNFHSCFVLKNLYKANLHLRSEEVLAAIGRGYEYYRRNLFTEDNTPKPFARLGRMNLVRLETYDYAEGISLGALMREKFPEAYEFSRKLCADLIAKYQLGDGHFVSKVSIGGIVNTMPYIRWPQAQIFYALSTMYKAEQDGKA